MFIGSRSARRGLLMGKGERGKCPPSLFFHFLFFFLNSYFGQEAHLMAAEPKINQRNTKKFEKLSKELGSRNLLDIFKLSLETGKTHLSAIFIDNARIPQDKKTGNCNQPIFFSSPFKLILINFQFLIFNFLFFIFFKYFILW